MCAFICTFVFFVLSFGTELMLIYVMYLPVYILVDVCMGGSVGWRDLLYNSGCLCNVHSRECCVITCFHIVKQT
jgi:hypothetical protein